MRSRLLSMLISSFSLSTHEHEAIISLENQCPLLFALVGKASNKVPYPPYAMSAFHGRVNSYPGLFPGLGTTVKSP